MRTENNKLQIIHIGPLIEILHLFPGYVLCIFCIFTMVYGKSFVALEFFFCSAFEEWKRQ